jgi:two-component system chemotaxis response regulator CheY
MTGSQLSKRLLVADDTQDMRVLLRIVLERTDFSIVAEATDGTEAWAMWEKNRDEGLFALILDQRMPGMTGLEVARQVLKERPQQRVVLLTAHLNDVLRAEAFALGVTAVVNKEDLTGLARHPALQG